MMQHIYVNFKRFDIPAEMGGVNRISRPETYGTFVVEHTKEHLALYDKNFVEFTQFYPESQIPGAVAAAKGSTLKIDVKVSTGEMWRKAGILVPSPPFVRLPP